MIQARYAARWQASSDGRNITGRIAPYDVDGWVNGPDGLPQRIRLAPGVFHRAVKAPQRVQLRFEHAEDRDILGRIGYGVTLTEAEDGLDGTFRAYSTAVGDQALAMITEGGIDGLSVGFEQRAAKRAEDGTLVITSGNLVEVSLVDEPAFVGAGVRTVASEADRPADTSALDERLRRMGYLPQT
jgi:HK97 family phage prohead protease